MDNVFNNLILRPNAQVETNLGNPWEIIPIRNRKNAKECTEIHLAGRNIDGLCGFEDFPNLEVLWINNNKVWTFLKLLFLVLFDSRLRKLKILRPILELNNYMLIIIKSKHWKDLSPVCHI